MSNGKKEKGAEFQDPQSFFRDIEIERQVDEEGYLPEGAPKARRPKAITVFSLLHIFGGAGMIYVLVFGAGALSAPAEGLGLSVYEIGAFALFLGAIAFASGIGMLRGAAWAWRLAIFYYVNAIFRAINSLLLVGTMSEQLAEADRGLRYYQIKFGGRIAVHLLVIGYYHRASVLRWFKLGRKAAIGETVLLFFLSGAWFVIWYYFIRG